MKKQLDELKPEDFEVLPETSKSLCNGCFFNYIKNGSCSKDPEILRIIVGISTLTGKDCNHHPVIFKFNLNHL